MAHCKILNPDLIPTFWRVGDQVVVRLFSEWKFGLPRAEQVLSEEQVRARITTPGEPWNKDLPDNMFARGEHIVASAAGAVYRDMGAVTMDFSRGLRSRENWSVNVLHTGFLSQAVERFAETFNTKMSRKHISAVQGRQQVLMITSRFGSDNLDGDVYMLFSINPTHGCVTNMDLGPLLAAADFAESSRTLLPTMRIGGPDEIRADDIATFSVYLIDPATDAPYPSVSRPVEVHLEATAGYLPRRRATAIDGRANFSLRALDLTPGDTIKVKAGWHNFTGAAEKIVRVV